MKNFFVFLLFMLVIDADACVFDADACVFDADIFAFDAVCVCF
jgi:hypothetical protein